MDVAKKTKKEDTPKTSKKSAPAPRGKDKKKPLCLAPSIEDYTKSLEYDGDNGAPLDVVAFFLAGDIYAVDVGFVEEVVRPADIAELPRMPSFIQGIMSLRGEMILVMDLKKRLSVKAKRESFGRVLVVTDGDNIMGLGVDRMSGMMTALTDLKKSPKSKDKEPFIKGVSSAGNKTVNVLDVASLLDFKKEVEGSRKLGAQ